MRIRWQAAILSSNTSPRPSQPCLIGGWCGRSKHGGQDCGGNKMVEWRSGKDSLVGETGFSALRQFLLSFSLCFFPHPLVFVKRFCFPHVLWWGESRVYEQAIMEQAPRPKAWWWRPSGERRCRCFVYWSALIESSSPVARVSSSSNHILIILRLSPVSVTNHSAHTPFLPLFTAQLLDSSYCGTLLILKIIVNIRGSSGAEETRPLDDGRLYPVRRWLHKRHLKNLPLED